MVNVKPLGKRVLVKRLEAKTSKGGILLPESAQEKPKSAKIIAVGPDCEGSGKVGDEIYFSTYAGSEVTIGGDEGYLILPLDEIFCVVEA